MKTILSFFTALALSVTGFAQTTTLTINRTTGQINAPTTGAIPNFTALQVGSVILTPVEYGANVISWLSDPTSANLRGAVTDETGTGGLVFSTSPTITGTGTATFANVIATTAITIPADAYRGMGKVYNTANGDSYGFEQVSGGQSGTGSPAVRFFSAGNAVSGAYISFGYYTTATAFTDYLKLSHAGATFNIPLSLTGGGTSTTPTAGDNDTSIATTAFVTTAVAAAPAEVDTNVAYVRTTGNDTTGDGSPGKPYLTIQEAYNDGFTTFDLGVGAFGNLALAGSGTPVLSFRGRGYQKTTMGFISMPLATITAYTVQDIGVQSVNISSIASGRIGGDSANLTVINVRVNSSISTSGTSGLLVGERGNHAGTMDVLGSCFTANVSADGGQGFDGDGATLSGDGGNGGTINITGNTVVTTNIVATNGVAGIDGGAGQGTPGTEGSINLRQGCDVPTPSSPGNGIGVIVNGAFYVAYP